MPRDRSGTRPQLRRPRSWPVRWRLALASAALTLLILALFAAVIGQLASDRIRNDFDRDLQSSVETLAAETRLGVFSATGQPAIKGPVLADVALASDAAIRVISLLDGRISKYGEDAGYLGPPTIGVHDHGPYRVATARLINPGTGQVVGFIQYGRNAEHVEDTVTRLWIFILLGVGVGTVLAALAGLMVADRAMRPIASLTATAREIAATRDPSRSMPQPTSEDEVAELARTLDQMLRSLDQAQSEREQAMRKQRAFVADASHELRTPLTSVIANLELLQEALAEPPQSDSGQALSSALRSSHRMSRLVADMLLLARADAGRLSERRDCDLAEIMEAAVAEVAPLANSHELRISAADSVPVHGNPDELHRMVANLLDNAIRHTPPGTRVEVRTVHGLGHGALEVSDDGPGIPQSLGQQVFDRFVRGSGPADTAAGAGTGLGLAIVRAVAQSHGGEVVAGISRDGGALVRVSLPTVDSKERISAPLSRL